MNHFRCTTVANRIATLSTWPPISVTQAPAASIVDSTARRRGNCLLKGPASQLPCAEDLGVTVDLLHISEGDPLGGQQKWYET